VNLTSAAELAVRLVNSAYQAPETPDPLGTASAFRALLADRPELSARVTRTDLDAVTALRAELDEVFNEASAGRGAAAAGRINALLARYPVHPELVTHDDQRWHIHLAEHGTTADRLGARTAYGLSLVASRFGLDRLGVCAIAACPRVFIDASPNRSRRYCAECATRANVTTIRTPARPAAGTRAAPAAS
jgi:predicted RNA-binding Zn ribbon-like protein